MKERIKNILEKGMKVFEFRAFKKEEVKWYHEMFLNLYYDEDTDLIYSTGLNAVSILLLAMILMICAVISFR